MRRDPGQDDDDDKLIPEWGQQADDQIIWAGVAVAAAIFFLVFGWNRFSGDDNPIDAVTEAIAGDSDGGADGEGDTDGATNSVAAPTPTTVEATTTTAEATTSTAEATTTTAAPTGPEIGDVEAAVAPLAGQVTPSLDGVAVTLTGFVADTTEETEAIEAAASVAGIERVTSELVLLEPAVAQVLADRGVVVATVDGVGTEITVSGTLQSEGDRQPTIDAASSVEGVTRIVDQLEVSVAEALNEMPTIPFGTGSATILTEGQVIVDEAAELLTGAIEAGASFEVRGYTDTTGDDQTNLELSQARAEAVVAALSEAGVDAAALTAVGLGETDQFATGDRPDALAANRVVRFEQIS